MERLRQEVERLDATGVSLIVVVVIGYVVGVASGWPDLNPAVLISTLSMTAVYLLLAYNAERYAARYPSLPAITLYFVLQMALALFTIALLGPGAWLIALPLAALAVQLLEPWWQRWIIYGGILLGLALPFILREEWSQALCFALTLSPAIVFVVVFTRLVDSEHEARREAEALAAELEAANRKLAAYSTQVEELSRSKERNRLAREIHDSLGHYLAVVNVQIRAA